MLRDTACATLGYDARAKVEMCEARWREGGGSSREEKQHKVKKGREAEGRGVTGESEREATDTSRR